MFRKLENPIELIIFSFLVCHGASFSVNTTVEFDFHITGDESGFHRTICYDVDVQSKYHGSSILIKETFPKDMYVDPYEISDKKEILLKGSVDCEIPAYLGNELEVQLCSSSMTHIHHICIPVHFRYQLPHHCGVYGKSALIKMSTPSILVKSVNNDSDGFSNKCFKSMEIDSGIYYRKPKVKCLNFQIPVGCTDHFYTVLFLTVLTISLSVFYLLFSLVTVCM